MSNFQCECIDLNLQTPTDYFGRFVFKPLGVGDGITIGNLFRRILLTNLPGISIVGVRIAGVNHEFSTVPGVREDVLEILLNLKDIIFKSQKEKESFGRFKIQGPAIITAANIELDPDIEVINPSQYIATIANNSILEMELKLDWGKGYVLAENQTMEEPTDFLKVDTVFMPIRRVVYNIETSISDTFEKQEQLILDIWTNGSITPLEAVSVTSKTIVDWFQDLDPFNQKTSLNEPLIEQIDIRLLPIEELHLSARAYNALKRAQINLIGELLMFSLSDLRKIKNFGQKSIQEVASAVETTYGICIDS